MLAEERWRDRCERYFSSLTDLPTAAAQAEATSKQRKQAKKWKKKQKKQKQLFDADYNNIRKQHNIFTISGGDRYNGPNVAAAAAAAAASAAGAERKTKMTKKREMKKTAEGRVIVRANGVVYQTKHRPFKGKQNAP
jgi:hypothetical protein